MFQTPEKAVQSAAIVKNKPINKHEKHTSVPNAKQHKDKTDRPTHTHTHTHIHTQTHTQTHTLPHAHAHAHARAPAPTHVVSEWSAVLCKQSRYFSIDLNPRLVFSNGSLIDLLIRSHVGRYLEFKAVNALYIYAHTHTHTHTSHISHTHTHIKLKAKTKTKMTIRGFTFTEVFSYYY